MLELDQVSFKVGFIVLPRKLHQRKDGFDRETSRALRPLNVNTTPRFSKKPEVGIIKTRSVVCVPNERENSVRIEHEHGIRRLACQCRYLSGVTDETDGSHDAQH